MSSRKGETAPSKEPNSFVRTFLMKLRKRRIIETLAAFIVGGWLLIEVVERLQVALYLLPGKIIDITVVSIIGVLACPIIWLWFRGTTQERGNHDRCKENSESDHRRPPALANVKGQVLYVYWAKDKKRIGLTLK